MPQGKHACLSEVGSIWRKEGKKWVEEKRGKDGILKLTRSGEHIFPSVEQIQTPQEKAVNLWY